MRIELNISRVPDHILNILYKRAQTKWYEVNNHVDWPTQQENNRAITLKLIMDEIRRRTVEAVKSGKLK